MHILGRRSNSIGAKIFIILILSSAVATIAYSGVFYKITVDNAIISKRTEATSLVRLASQQLADPIYFFDIDGADAVIKNLKNNGEFDVVYVLSPDGRVITDGTNENRFYGAAPPDPKAAMIDPEKGKVSVDVTGRTMHVTYPIIAHEAIGYIHADVSLEVLDSISSDTLRNLVIFAALTSGISILASLFVSRAVSAPIHNLKEAAIKIASGDYSNQISIQGEDEIGQLSRQFELMRKNVLHSKENLESAVQARTLELQKAYDELKRSDKMKDEFISVASHELRTPIQPILMYAQLCRAGTVSPEVATSAIEVQAKRLKQLTEDILDVSRIEGGRFLLNKEKVDVNELVKNVVHGYSIGLGTRIRLSVDLSRSLDGNMMELDKGRITQVLTNLIGNAVKFTQEGTITVRTMLSESEKSAIIQVTDTGQGISAELMPKLFGKFVTRQTNGNLGGTGLGLYISRAIVQAHGGMITAQNNDGKGATFSFALPTIPAESGGIAVLERV